MNFKQINKRQFILESEKYHATILIFEDIYILEIKEKDKKEFQTFVFSEFEYAEEKAKMILFSIGKKINLGFSF
jgi:hypothetical protein